MMIRHAYINNLVLSIYSELPVIKFPLDLKQVLPLIPRCKYMSYQRFAQINHCSINDVINICESQSGCTHYDIMKDRYLILCNISTSGNNNLGRQRWTCCHEIGHVLCKHHQISTYEKLAENSLTISLNPEYEKEADYFAATLLAPFPLFRILNINSPADIQNTFCLSSKASEIRFNEYIHWKNSRTKSAWENDIIRIYRNKSQII